MLLLSALSVTRESLDWILYLIPEIINEIRTKSAEIPSFTLQ